MSLENARRFVRSLEQECQTSPAPGTTLDQLMKMAEARGLPATRRDLARAIDERVQSWGELDDAALDGISAAGFEDFDGKAQAFYDMLANVIRTIQEMRANVC